MSWCSQIKWKLIENRPTECGKSDLHHVSNRTIEYIVVFYIYGYQQSTYQYWILEYYVWSMRLCCRDFAIRNQFALHEALHIHATQRSIDVWTYELFKPRRSCWNIRFMNSGTYPSYFMLLSSYSISFLPLSNGSDGRSPLSLRTHTLACHTLNLTFSCLPQHWFFQVQKKKEIHT